jgi:exo-beta-1,3-glucanase (GH17 family)
VIAGNETQLRGGLEADELYGYLDRLRAALVVPVSTAEPWHVWLRQPTLADHVDFITVHLLPYWEGVPVEEAVDYALQRYAEVRQRFPGKPVVIGEIGWPSHGDRRAAALATPDREARFRA